MGINKIANELKTEMYFFRYSTKVKRKSLTAVILYVKIKK